MFHSYKGGSGKSLLSTNLAYYLVEEYNKKVLLIEGDFTMPSFRTIFKDLDPDYFFNDFLQQDGEDLSSAIYPNPSDQFGRIFCAEEFLLNDPIHGSDQEWFLKKRIQIEKALLKLDYDYVIFDTSPGLHLFTINLLTLSNSVYIVMRSDLNSFHGLDVLLNRMYKRSVRLLEKNGILINVVFNQIPIVDQMIPILDRWTIEIKSKHNYIKSSYLFNYDVNTAYLAAIQTFPLSKDTDLIKHLKSLILDIFEDE